MIYLQLYSSKAKCFYVLVFFFSYKTNTTEIYCMAVWFCFKTDRIEEERFGISPLVILMFIVHTRHQGQPVTPQLTLWVSYRRPWALMRRMTASPQKGLPFFKKQQDDVAAVKKWVITGVTDAPKRVTSWRKLALMEPKGEVGSFHLVQRE